jgi:hypothetical protein
MNCFPGKFIRAKAYAEGIAMTIAIKLLSVAAKRLSVIAERRSLLETCAIKSSSVKNEA